MPFVLIVILGWLYVALMMALAEATHSNGTVLGGIFTFVLYGAAPVALAGYILMTPARKRAIKAREKAEQEKEKTLGPGLRRDDTSGAPDGDGETAADAVAPVRKEP